MRIARWEMTSFALLAGLALLLVGSGSTTGGLASDLTHFKERLFSYSNKVAATFSFTPEADTDSDLAALLASFPEVPIEGEAAVIIDARTGEVLYGINHNTPLPLASLTKLATALVADNLLSDNTPIRITRTALAEEGDNALRRDDIWNKKALTDFSLIVSSNDGARALADAGDQVIAAARTAGTTSSPYLAGAGSALGTNGQNGTTPMPRTFVEAMNAYTQVIGLPGLVFNNPTGLDVSSSTAGAYGSAVDIAGLLRYMMIHTPELVEATAAKTATFKPKSGLIYTAQNTDIAIPDISGLIASKTGFTDLAQGNLIVAFDADIGRPMIAAVLGSSPEGRFADILALIHATRGYFGATMSQ